MKNINLFTIGFTKKSAASFFERLRDAGVNTVIDTRLHNVSQLAGFAKKEDLKYFLKEICNVDYMHLPDFAPTAEMLDEYRNVTQDWSQYEKKFIKLITKRQIENCLTPKQLNGACLLCSEDKPHHCHRRLVAEYLQSKLDSIKIQHL